MVHYIVSIVETAHNRQRYLAVLRQAHDAYAAYINCYSHFTTVWLYECKAEYAIKCKHKLQLHERESIFRILVRLKDAEKVVYIMLRNNRDVRTVQLKLEYVVLAC